MAPNEKCPKCGFLNPSWAKYCAGCGQTRFDRPSAPKEIQLDAGDTAALVAAMAQIESRLNNVEQSLELFERQIPYLQGKRVAPTRTATLVPPISSSATLAAASRLNEAVPPEPEVKAANLRQRCRRHCRLHQTTASRSGTATAGSERRMPEADLQLGRRTCNPNSSPLRLL